MTDSKTESASGPYVVAAIICERVLQERDGASSLIRIVDRFTLEATGPDAPEEMPPMRQSFTLFIALKSGHARGSVPMRLTLTDPSGLERPKPLDDRSVFFEGGTRGQNLVINAHMEFKEPGPYWINIYIGDRFVTRTPIEIIYIRRRSWQEPAPGSGGQP